jgi:pyruvate ferredoxin oxidoreductase gamma subunit/2-oxoisovalerate ferredoxin oxidoreductase gamma subunit
MIPQGQFVVNSKDAHLNEVRKMAQGVGVGAYVVDADRIAIDLIGTPTVSTIMLGALAGASGFVSADSLESSVRERFSGNMGDVNAKMIRMGFKEVHQV